MPTFCPEMRTFAQRVCSLYKTALRTTEWYYCDRVCVRYRQVLVRARFDATKCVSDPMERRRLLYAGENEVFSCTHPVPGQKFANSVGLGAGVAAGRDVNPPDWVLDYWHPLEKARYPEYFLKRECRKPQYIDMWNRGVLC